MKIQKWETKTLGEIANEIRIGSGVVEYQLGTGDYPAVKNKDLAKLPQQFYECRSFVNPDVIENKKFCCHGDVLISGMNNVIEYVGRVCW